MWHSEQAAALASIMTDLQLEVFSLRKAEPALQGLLGQVLPVTWCNYSDVGLR